MDYYIVELTDNGTCQLLNKGKQQLLFPVLLNYWNQKRNVAGFTVTASGLIDERNQELTNMHDMVKMRTFLRQKINY